MICHENNTEKDLSDAIASPITSLYKYSIEDYYAHMHIYACKDVCVCACMRALEYQSQSSK